MINLGIAWWNDVTRCYPQDPEALHNFSGLSWSNMHRRTRTTMENSVRIFDMAWEGAA